MLDLQVPGDVEAVIPPARGRIRMGPVVGSEHADRRMAAPVLMYRIHQESEGAHMAFDGVERILAEGIPSVQQVVVGLLIDDRQIVTILPYEVQ